MRVHCIALIFSFLIGIFIVSCGDSDKTVLVSKKDPLNNSSSQLMSHELRKGSQVLDPIDGPPPHKRFLVAFKGYLSSSEQRLYIASSRAELGAAQAVGGSQLQFLEMAPMNETNYLLVLTEENKKKSIGRLNVQTNFLYNFLSDMGDVFDLQLSNASQFGFLKREPDGSQALNVFFVDSKETRKKNFSPNESITYQFAPHSDFLIYTKTENNRSSIFKMKLEKESFGESELILEKEGVRFSHVVINNDENKIYFVEKSESLSKLKILDLASQEEVSIFETENIYEPALSPNDQYLTFWSESSEGQKLLLYEFLSKNLEVITVLSVPSKTHNPSYYHNRTHPVWTPDSREIIFSSFNRWYGQIRKYDLVTKTIHVLTDNTFVDFHAPIILGEENP